MGDEGAAMISEGMKSNSTLTSLNLESEEEKQKRRKKIDKKKKKQRQTDKQERIKCEQGIIQEQKEPK